jgi:transposase
LHKSAPGVDRRLTMKYTKEEKLDIGRRIYNGELSRYTAAVKYDISDQTSRDYIRMYRDVHSFLPKHDERGNHRRVAPPTPPIPCSTDTPEQLHKGSATLLFVSDPFS